MEWLKTSLVALLCIALLPGCAVPEQKGPPAVVELLEDDTEGVLKQFNNDGGLDGTMLGRDFRDFYSGVCSVRVTPFQRFSSRLAGWNFTIAEKPQPGQYRYLRFAWKRLGGAGIMIQLHTSAGSWNQRYVAGHASPSTAGWGARLTLTDKLPADWVVVTRDLFKDFGPFTLTGLALTPMEGGTAGLFDHFYLGRSVADLDHTSAAVLGKTPLKASLPRATLEQLWQDLASRDVAVAGRAVRTLVAGRKDSVPFLRERLRPRPLTGEEKRIAQLIVQLDDNVFRVREAASRELEKLGEAAAPWLLKALQESESTEVRRRCKTLLDRRGYGAGSLTVEQVRGVRVIRILEWAGTPEARQTLEQFTGTTLGAELADDVRQALARLRQRP